MVEDLGRQYKEVKKDLEKKAKEVDLTYSPFSDMHSVERGRDDVDAYRAAEALLDSYAKIDKEFILLLRNGTRKKFQSEQIIQEYKNLKKKLQEKKAEVLKERHYPWNSVEATISKLASQINDAEQKIQITKKKVMEATREDEEIITPSKEKSGKTYMKRVVGGKMQFTSDCNSVNIQTAMSEFFRFDGTTNFEIDYTGCKNEKLKSSIRSKIGSLKAIIKYDPKTKTCPLIDANTGKILYKNAPIYDGVTVERTKWKEIKQEEERVKEQPQTNYNEKIKDDVYKYRKEKEIPQKLRLVLYNADKDGKKGLIKTFITKCESRLDQLIKSKKKQNSELNWNEPISRLWRSAGLMEAHFVNPKSNCVIFSGKETNKNKNSNRLPSELYDILDHEEGSLKTYLTDRIKAKWAESDNYEMRTKTELALRKFTPIDEKEKNWQHYQSCAIGSFLNMTNKLMSTNGHSGKLKELQNHCKDMQFSLQEIQRDGKWANRDLREKKVEELKDKFIDYRKSLGVHFAKFIKIDTKRQSDEEAKNVLDQIFTSTSEEFIAVKTREIGNGLTILDNTSTSDVTEQVKSDLLGDNDKIELGPRGKTEYIKNCENTLKRINDFYGINIKGGEISPTTKKNIDQLYNNINSPEQLYNHLKLKGIIKDGLFGIQTPFEVVYNGTTPSWNQLDNEVKNYFKKMQEDLVIKNREASKVNLTGNDIKKRLQDENEELMAKSHMTDEDKKNYQIKNALIEDPTALEKMAKGETDLMKNIIKYGGVNNIIHNSISEKIIRLAGGFKGSTEFQKIYNDAKGLGGGPFEFSDETNQALLDHAYEVILDVIITAIVAVISHGTSIYAGATWLAKKIASRGKWAKIIVDYVVTKVNAIIAAIKNSAAYKKLMLLKDQASTVVSIGKELAEGSDMYKKAAEIVATIPKPITKYVAHLGESAYKDMISNFMKTGKVKININVFENLENYVKSGIYGKFCEFAGKAGKFIEESNIFKMHFDSRTTRFILEHTTDYFGGALKTLGWEGGQISGAPLLTTITTTGILSKSKILTKLVSDNIKKYGDALISHVYERDGSVSAVEVKLGKEKDTTIKISSEGIIVASNNPELPKGTNLLVS